MEPLPVWPLDAEQLRVIAIAAGLLALVAGRSLRVQYRRQSEARVQVDHLSASIDDVISQTAAAYSVLAELQRRAAQQSHTVAMLEYVEQRLESLAPAELLPALLDALARCLPVHAASVYLLYAGRLYPRAHLPVDQPAPDPNQVSSSPAVRRALATGKAELDDAEAACPVMAAPLTGADGTVLGVVTLDSIPPISVCGATLHHLEMIAASASRGLRQALKSNHVTPAAAFDELLPVLAFPELGQRISEEVQRARRCSRPLSLVVLRVDHEGSWSAEDEAAWQRLVAARACGALRQSDAVGRHPARGGVICVLPEAPADS
jgi:hypothetical protein